MVVVRLPDSTTSQTPDIVRMAPGPKADVKPVVATPNSEGLEGFSLSPDGRWIAYTSSATGTQEVWVQPYPGPGAAVRVSPNGGNEPIWARNGRELYYLEGRRMMAVQIQEGTTFSFSPARFLFENTHAESAQAPSYDVAADGRFLMVRGSGARAAVPPSCSRWTGSRS